MKNVFDFMWWGFLLLQIFPYLLWLFGYLEKRLDKRAKANFDICDTKAWMTNNYNIYYLI